MNLIDPVSLSKEEWTEYFLLDVYAVDWHAQPVQFIAMLTEFLKNSGNLINKFSAEDINTAFWCLLGESGVFTVFGRSEIPLQQRLECVNAMTSVFSDLFAIHCSSKLSAGLREVDSEMSPLNSVCYMWWDLFPGWGNPNVAELRAIDEALLQVQETCLTIDHEAVRESALHGLGHWHLNYPDETEKIVDKFLLSEPGISDRLKQYAQSARCGCVN
jgi:hypothetical protein